MEKRGTIAVVKTRRKEVMELYTSGTPSYQIKEIITAKYNISDSAVDDDIAACKKDMMEAYTADIPELVAKHLTMYYENAAWARKQGDIRAANDSLTRIEKLLGLHKPDITLQQNNIVSLDTHSLEDLLKMAEELNKPRELKSKDKTIDIDPVEPDDDATS